jgi:hypothetical protein
MMNMRNNEGCTPLFLAIQARNGDMVEWMMDCNALYMPDITLKNKNGETVREFMERNIQHSYDPMELSMKDIFEKYHKYENRILVKAIVGVTSSEKFISPKSLSHKEMLRSIFNNFRNDKEYMV